MKESMKWGSDTMLNIPKDDQPLTSSSDKDLPGTKIRHSKKEC